MRMNAWSLALGVALGGFFDGIVLHQVLQWHHLLSLVPGVTDLRTQVLWDGYFHGLMYLIAAVALWGLWRRRGDLTGRGLAAGLLCGFGLWHVLDAILSHWLLGIHRIRVDAANPLLWDLIWFGVFGVVPLAAGLLLLRRGPGKLQPAAFSLALLTFGTAGAGAWALQPPPGQAYATIAFAPGQTPQQVWSALDAAGARLVWSDPDMAVVVAKITPADRWKLYRHGALLVSGSGFPAGCFGWSRT